MGFGGCFGCPDESVGMKMGVLSFPGERIFGYELPPGGKFCITGVFLLGEGVFPYLKGMSLWGCCCIALFDLGRGGVGMALPLAQHFCPLEIYFWGGGLYQGLWEGGC